MRRPGPRVPAHRRLIISAMGKEGGGKTNLYTTAPKPLLALSCDPNTESVLCSAFDVDSVADLDPEVCRYVHIPYPLVGFETDEEDVKREAREAWEVLTHEVSDVLNGRAAVAPVSVALDSGTEINTLNILAEFGRNDKIPPAVRRNRMGAVNDLFKGIFRALEHAGVHVIVTHRVKSHWETMTTRTSQGEVEKDVEVPGVFDRIGFREMGNMCNVEVLMRFDPTRSEDRVSERFGMEILRATPRPALVGQTWWGREKVEGQRLHVASFQYLALQLFPNTSLEDWQ